MGEVPGGFGPSGFRYFVFASSLLRVGFEWQRAFCFTLPLSSLPLLLPSCSLSQLCTAPSFVKVLHAANFSAGAV